MYVCPLATTLIDIAFTAVEDSEIYLNSRLNGIGDYYLDNVVITEDLSNVDFTSTVLENAVTVKGTAIRTVGKQGMRHKTQIDKQLLTSDMTYGVRVLEYGTVAIKTEYLGENQLC